VDSFLVTPAHFFESSGPDFLDSRPRKGLKPGFALENRCSHASASELREEGEGIYGLGQPRRSESLERALNDESAGHSSDCASGNRWSIHGSVHQYRTTTIGTPAHFDANSAGPTLGVGRPKHRKSSGQSISPSRRHARGDAANTREGRDQHECIGKFRSVAILRTNGVGEPTQFAPGTARSRVP